MNYKSLKRIYDFLQEEDFHNIHKLTVISAVEDAFGKDESKPIIYEVAERLYDEYLAEDGKRDIWDFVAAMFAYYVDTDADPSSIELEDVLNILDYMD